MESESKAAPIHEFSQGILKKEDVRAQTQSIYNGDYLDRIHRHNNEFTNSTKIFVGGLPVDLTIGEFEAYFKKFGPIEDVVVMSDKETNRPRGFGFVTFESPETANNVLKNRFYKLKNKRVEVKKAVSKDRMSRNSGNHYDTYNAVYNGNVLPLAALASYGGHYYAMTGYGYGWEGISYIYYPYESFNPGYYVNNYPYQSWYYCADTYPYRSSSYYYGNTPYSSKHLPKYRNRRVKTNGDSDEVTKNVKLATLHLGSDGVGKENGDKECDNSRLRDGDSNVLANGDGVGKENGDTECDHSRPRDDDSNVLANGDCDHAEISEGFSLQCNGDGDDDGGCAKVIQALVL